MKAKKNHGKIVIDIEKDGECPVGIKVDQDASVADLALAISALQDLMGQSAREAGGQVCDFMLQTIQRAFCHASN